MPACVKTLHHMSGNNIMQSDLEMHSFALWV